MKRESLGKDKHGGTMECCWLGMGDIRVTERTKEIIYKIPGVRLSIVISNRVNSNGTISSQIMVQKEGIDTINITPTVFGRRTLSVDNTEENRNKALTYCRTAYKEDIELGKMLEAKKLNKRDTDQGRVTYRDAWEV